MIRSVLCGTFALLAGSALAIAAPKDDVSAAAKKLASANNYTWKQTTENAGGQGGGGGGGRRGGFGGPVEGKMADGYTLTTTGTGDNARQTVRKGEKVVIQTQDGWQTPQEMQANNPNGGQGGQGRRGGRGGMFGATSPAQSVEAIINATKELNKSGDAYEGDLTEEGAKSLMFGGGARRGGGGGQGGPEVTGAKGHAKFWVKDGMLNKYEYTVSGTVSFNGNDQEINRTTKVEVSDVGSTKVNIPEEAKKKLES